MKWIQCKNCLADYPVADNERLEDWEACDICGDLNWELGEANGPMPKILDRNRLRDGIISRKFLIGNKEWVRIEFQTGAPLRLDLPLRAVGIRGSVFQFEK